MARESTTRSIAADAIGDCARDDSLLDNEFSLSDREFNEIRVVVKKLTGISIGDSKRQLVYRRIAKRLKATNINTFQGYLDYLKNGDPSEHEHFANAVTTNLTSFFREKHHFDFLAKTIIPEIEASKGNSGKRLRIWSAGCSTGEEPYSIAITLRESLKNLNDWDAKVLCTDLDSAVLNTCRAGEYSLQRAENIPTDQLRRWFKKSQAQDVVQLKVKPALLELLTFRQLNLMDDWPMRGLFDVIFCRNVIIYFDKPTQRVLIDRYADILEAGGYLILGHSESLFSVTDRFSLIGKTIYRKKTR